MPRKAKLSTHPSDIASLRAALADSARHVELVLNGIKARHINNQILVIPGKRAGSWTLVPLSAKLAASLKQSVAVLKGTES